ncbi:MAG: hypothetical protein CM1200mP3_03210 [Chloroflexota bacterium]|nr:MAG: hypothetical protein CM1200mP3_03210 [Chloroflexota bacterium]
MGYWYYRREARDFESLYEFKSDKIDVISAGVDSDKFKPVPKKKLRD